MPNLEENVYSDNDEGKGVGAEADMNNLDTFMAMDVKSAFLYGTIEEEVYVCQPPSFEDPKFPKKVYKVEKALYDLHQAPRAWYETLSTYLLENRFKRGTIDKTLFTKKDKDDAQEILGEFYGGIFLRLQVKQKDDGIFISQDKYVGDILKKFYFAIVKTTSTPIKTNNALLKDEEAEDMIFRYLKGQPKLDLWYPRDLPFDLEAFLDNEVVIKEWEDRMERAATTASSLEAEQDNVQALVDKKKVIITETSIRSDLKLDDAEGIDCLPTATIFAELAKTTAWNEFSSTIASAIICLATNHKFHFSKYIFDNMVKHLEVGVKFLMYPRFVQVFLDKQVEGMTKHKEVYVTSSYTKKVFSNMKRLGNGFSGRVTPLFPTMMIQASKDMGEDSASPSDSHSTPIIS
ncbi:copia protein [Tanacetum coccineum]